MTPVAAITPLTTLLLVFAALLGLVIGSFLNVVIARLPHKESLNTPSRCPKCAAAIKPWQNIPVLSWIMLRGRCASCGERISVRYPLVEALTGTVFALVAGAAIHHTHDTGVAAAVLLFVAYAIFASISIALAFIDLDTFRLPNALTLPAYPLLIALLIAASLASGDWAALLRALIGAAVLWAFYGIIRLIRPDAMGGGDVKLAGTIGLMLAYLGWGALAVGAFAAFLFGGVFGIALMLARRAGRKTAVPFGPWMILGAWFGAGAGNLIASWYLELVIP